MEVNPLQVNPLPVNPLPVNPLEVNPLQGWRWLDPEQQRLLERERHYQEAQRFLAAEDWQPAEGLLWWLRQVGGWHGVVPVEQPLGLCLVMDGQFPLAWQLLAPLLDHPQRNFWVAHLAGDAQRGRGALPEAVALYRQSLADGSDSPITVRNLVQVLWQLDGEAAIAQLAQWHGEGLLRGARLQGVRDALAPGQAPALEVWLAERGLATPAQLQRLVTAALLQLDLDAAWLYLDRLEGPGHGWAQALRGRLQRLGVAGISHGPLSSAAAAPAAPDGWV